MSWLEKDVMDLVEIIDSTFDEETGTWNDEDKSVIQDLAREEIDPTMERYARAMNYYDNSAKALGEEIKRLQARKKHFENSAEHIKQRLDFAVKCLNGGQTYKTLNFTFAYRKSTSVNVADSVDASTLPSYLVRCKYEVDKTAIKDLRCEGGIVYDNEGNPLVGIKIEEKKSLNVK